jgi:hypothetical protein
MQPLSATEAISPAWSHTRNLLLAPRRFGLLFKVTLIACLTLAGQSVSYGPPRAPHAANAPHEFVLVMLGFQMFMSFVFLAVALVFFYLGSRLQFVLFDVVLRGDTFIAPIWQRFGRVTWKWIGLKLFLIIPLLLVMVPFTIRIAHFSEQAFPPGTAPTWPALVHFFAGFLRIMLEIMALGMLFAVFYGLVQDFGLPSIAMENTPLRETVERIFHLIRAEPGQVALYVLLRMLLMFVGGVAAEIGATVVAAVALVPFGVVGYALYKFLLHGALTGRLLFGFGAGLLIVAYLALLFCLIVIAIGYLYTFLQSYALFFLGGRYPMVGQYMERFLPQPVYAQPQPWAPGLYTPPSV